MSHSTVAARAALTAVCLAGLSAAAGAQQAAKPRHPAVCTEGVHVYNDRAQLPAKRDSIVIPPPPGGQIRVNSPEEADAAELELRRRAGAAGATSLLVLTETEDDGAGMRMRRTVAGFFITADSVRAAGICKK